MITTRESINYQFSIIFGYSSPNDFITGDVIGPGRLTKQKVNQLSQEVIKFLMMYNALLRDYTGSELFSIEFDLFNIDEKTARTNIYPKSMILIPGKFKDCESLLLALKPETGYLDVHKSRASIDNISKLFYEVEEFADRPEFDNEEKQKLYNKFASRFSKKLYGDLVEDKWNKKLIGISTSLPTEEKLLITYGKIKSNVDILWHKQPIQINLSNHKFEKSMTLYEGKQAVQHLKYAISEPSANFIVDKTLSLGTSLINLANIGTLDEYQDKIILLLINNIKDEINNVLEPVTSQWLIQNTFKILLKLERYLNKFLEYSRNFLTSGEMGDLYNILEKYTQFINNKGKLENEDFNNICQIAYKFISDSVIKKENLRVMDLSSVFNYFSEIINSSLSLIRTSLPSYLSIRRMKYLTIRLIENLNNKFNNEQKPAKILGLKFIEKFKEYIINKIELNSILTKDLEYNEDKLQRKFNALVNNNVDSFFDQIGLKLEDLISFAEIQMENNVNLLKVHVEKFKKLSTELHYLLGYILRHSTINRFIKEEPEKDVTDPVNFANRFHRFLEKRIGGINLEWKSYVLEWINDYAKKFFKFEENKNWSLIEIFNDFINYLEERESKEQKLENFLEFLDRYIAKISDAEEKRELLEFYKHYEYCININLEFPKYVRSKIKQELSLVNDQKEKLIPTKYFKLNETDSFYNYIKKGDLQYFSKLVPRPLTLILKHILTNKEKEQFKGELFHVINFKFWHTNAQFELSDNFKEVYREWMK
ncbi:MAG: hypothetical protein ACFFB0_17010 [Promethearchaeota archaeon]